MLFLEFVSGTKAKKDNSLKAVNELDLADALEKLKSNDPNLTSLNVNNHKDINELNAIEKIIECIPENTHLKILCMANTQMHDRHAKVRTMSEVAKNRYIYTTVKGLLNSTISVPCQCCSQPNNLVLLCKFRIIIIYFF